MTYLYDILLNFNQELVEFFEWESKDKIYYIKQIPIFKVESIFLDTLLHYDVKIDKSFYNKVLNETEFYDDEESLYAMSVFYDNDRVIGVLFDDKKVLGVSRLVIDEESEALKIGSRLPLTLIDYEAIDIHHRFRSFYLTRSEMSKRKVLLEEFQNLYDTNRIEKLNYYYYEYFNEICCDKDYVLNRLKNSLNEFNQKHEDLYKIICLSSSSFERNM